MILSDEEKRLEMIYGVGDQKAHTQPRAYLLDDLTKWGVPEAELQLRQPSLSKYSKPSTS